MKKFENKVLVVGYYQGDSRCFEFACIMACGLHEYGNHREYSFKDTILMKEVEEEDVPYLSKFYHVQRVRVH